MSSGIPLFNLNHTLIHHTKPINTLKISGDGTMLISGADDGTLAVWDLGSRKCIQIISVVFNGPVSAAAWTPLAPDSLAETFIFGCSDGSLHPTYDYASSFPSHEGAIEDISYDPRHHRVASVGGGVLKVWSVDSTGQLSNITSTPARPRIARSVSFYDN
ncbi:WD40-repeat-containing domain protein [Infundibulicybe gibba]|nr:WD40-repeat-containing domain protein [Infundibulicybe gibba]